MRTESTPRKSFRRRLCRLGLSGVVSLILLAMAGAVWQAVATRRIERQHPPPGRLVDVGGHRLHVHVRGTGSPTVVIATRLDPARTTSGTWVGGPDWLETQYALTNISRRSSLVIADTTEHDIQFHRPGQIVAAVREMMTALHQSLK